MPVLVVPPFPARFASKKSWRPQVSPPVTEQGNRIRALYRYRNRYRLSPAALETLALVAYRQPITAVEIQDMRGTCSASVLKTLLERKLIRLSGRKRVVGRPILYSTGIGGFLAGTRTDSNRTLPLRWVLLRGG